MQPSPFQQQCKRRTFLAGSGIGLGATALGLFLGRDAKATAPETTRASGLPDLPHHRPRVKRVIFLCMAGGPSHLETFDYKPKLAELDGQPMPESFTQGQPIAQLQGQQLKCQGPLTRFRKYGRTARRSATFCPGTPRWRTTSASCGRGHRADQSRSGAHIHEYGHRDQRSTVDGFLGQLRSGLREPRICRASSC